MQTFAQITEFTVDNAEGIAIHYEVIDQIAKTVQVGNGSSAAINTGTIGAVTIPETVYDENGVRYTVTEIADVAFKKCSKLPGINIPGSVEKIGEEAFTKCKKLVSVEIPPAVTEISASAFENCGALSFVRIHAGVTQIDAEAFIDIGNDDINT